MKTNIPSTWCCLFLFGGKKKQYDWYLCISHYVSSNRFMPLWMGTRLKCPFCLQHRTLISLTSHFMYYTLLTIDPPLSQRTAGSWPFLCVTPGVSHQGWGGANGAISMVWQLDFFQTPATLASKCNLEPVVFSYMLISYIQKKVWPCLSVRRFFLSAQCPTHTLKTF